MLAPRVGRTLRVVGRGVHDSGVQLSACVTEPAFMRIARGCLEASPRNHEPATEPVLPKAHLVLSHACPQ